MSTVIYLTCDTPGNRRSLECVGNNGPNIVANGSAREVRHAYTTLTNTALHNGWRRKQWRWLCPQCVKGNRS